MKLEHDADQLESLVAQGKLPRKFLDVVSGMRSVSSSFMSRSSVLSCVGCPLATGRAAVYSLTDDDREAMLHTYNRIIYLPPTYAVLPDRALNVRTGKELQEIEERYFSEAPVSHAHIDEFLSAQALERLREFCMHGSIWYEVKRDQRYLGAYLDDGFSAPLLYQIADELRHAYPNIFADHPLNYAWAYKYDDMMAMNQTNVSQGIGLHGDEAAVNVNFWITEDDANLDPTSGGLVIHKVAAPIHWSFSDYNDPRQRSKLEVEVAKQRHQAIVVPHRSNRMVMFNSSLFHETDTFNFKPGFKNRRINLTMLFGKRN